MVTPQYVEAIVAADRDLLLADLDNILTGLLQRVSDRELNKISNQYVAGHNLQVEEVWQTQASTCRFLPTLKPFLCQRELLVSAKEYH